MGGWFLGGWMLARTLLQVALVSAGFVVVSSLGAGFLETDGARAGFGAAISLGLPILLAWRLRAAAEVWNKKRKRRLRVPSFLTLVAATNLVIAVGLSFGFADDIGRVLRRRGDWFLGERNGWVARKLRLGLGSVAMYLEHFDPPAELAPVILPPDPDKIPFGPWRPGEEPPETRPTMLSWFHPLAGPRRALPLSASRRFGAERPQPRPSECELGHCGVDLGTALGEPVFAVFDGIIEKIERDESEGGRAGRFVRIGHKEGTVVSRYIHLDTIRAELKPGDHVKGGDLIGRLGRSGVHNSGAHLHFGLSLRAGGRSGSETYIDPEPYLRRWQLVDAATVVAAR